jgi:hypothetical protein
MHGWKRRSKRDESASLQGSYNREKTCLNEKENHG